MFKATKEIKDFFLKNIAFVLLFLCISISYPVNFKYIIPIITLLGGYQFFKSKKNEELLRKSTHNFLLLLIFSLIFFRTIHTIILAFCLVSSGYLYFKTNSKKRNINFSVELFSILFFLLIVLNLAIFKPYFKLIDTYLYLIFYPILFYFFKKSNVKINVYKSLKVFILSTAIASVELFFLNLFNDKLQLKTNTFFAEYLDLTHVYFGVFLGVSCTFILILFKEESKLKYKYLYLSCFLFFLGIFIYIGARMALLSVIVLLGIYLLKDVSQFSLKKRGILVFASLAFLILSYKAIPRVSDGFFYLKQVYTSVKTNNKENLVLNSWRNVYQRFLVTKYTLTEIKENFYLGIGLQNVRDTLGKKIHKDGYIYYVFINPHNQYLHTFLAMGIFSFIFLIVMLAYFVKQQYHHPYFIVFFLMLMLTESVLVRVKGISIFFLFSIILSLKNKLADD